MRTLARSRTRTLLAIACLGFSSVPALAQPIDYKGTTIGIIPDVVGRDDVEKNMRKYMQQHSEIKRIYAPKSADDLFNYLAKLKKEGVKIDNLVLAAHGQSNYPGLQFGGVNDSLDYKYVELPKMLARRDTLVRALDNPATDDKRRAAIRKSYEEMNAQIEKLSKFGDIAGDVMAPNATVLLINCSAADTDQGKQFCRDLGKLLLQKNGGSLVASTIDVTVDYPKKHFDQLYQWVKDGQNLAIGEVFIEGDWVKFTVPPVAKVPVVEGSINDHRPLSDEHKELAKRIRENDLLRYLGAHPGEPVETDKQRQARVQREYLQDKLKQAERDSEQAKAKYEAEFNRDNWTEYLKSLAAVRAAREQVEALMVPVPDVYGHPLQDASDIIGKAKLDAAPVPAGDAANDRLTGRVHSQSPAAGTRVPIDSSVEIMYFRRPNAGKEAVKVPDLYGKQKELAEKLLKDAKLNGVGKPAKEKKPASAKFNDVFTQEPKAGAEVTIDDVVKYQYYAGVPVGDYAHKTKAEAEQAIKALGLVPDVKPGEVQPRDANDRGKVRTQDPAPGQLASLGDTVHAELYKQLQRGFLDGDGAQVDGRFATAKVSENRTAIEFNSGRGGPGKETRQVIGWSIKGFDTAAAARQHYSQYMKQFPEIQSVAGFKVLERSIGASSATITYDLKSDRNEGSMHTRCLVYREFVITLGRVEPQSGYDFSKQTANIVKKSRELIDLRFPPE